MAGIITTRRIWRDDISHIHPKTGERLELGEGDFFLMTVESTEVGLSNEENEIVSILITRTILEQVITRMEEALNMCEVKFKRVS